MLTSNFCYAKKINMDDFNPLKVPVFNIKNCNDLQFNNNNYKKKHHGKINMSIKTLQA